MKKNWLFVLLLVAVLSSGTVFVYQYYAFPNINLINLPLSLNKPGNNPSPTNPPKLIREDPAALKVVAEKLLNDFLSGATKPDAPENSRLKSFEIHEVKIDMIEAVCFGFTADFSVEPNSLSNGGSPNVWTAGNGTIDEKWVRQKSMFFNAVEINGAFRISDSGTGRAQPSCR